MQGWKTFACLASFLFSATAVAGAGVIHGRVRVPLAARSRVEMRQGPPCGAGDVVVFVDRLGDRPPKLPRPPELLRMVQTRHSFLPRVLAVPAGVVVEFHNQDIVYHNVFSVSPSRRFDLGKYAPGQTRRVQFDSTGVVNLFCDIHPDMAAFLVVVPNMAYARPAASGAYALPSLPRGNYVVHAWGPGLDPLRREIEVPGRGSVNLDLSF